MTASREGEAALVQCPLCGGRFHGQEACANGCPLSGSCRTLCCPYCHYRFVEQSAVVDWLGRLFKGRRA
ncbi:MAG TPA: hypothetical protein VMT19_05775 [Thermoanaerobaculaceae bacterium]|nr:hypothetical protein [Thermoanaerobaculaceae bacterium]